MLAKQALNKDSLSFLYVFFPSFASNFITSIAIHHSNASGPTAEQAIYTTVLPSLHTISGPQKVSGPGKRSYSAACLVILLTHLIHCER